MRNFRGTHSYNEMLKGYMAAESLGILLRSEIRAASAQSFALRQQATIEVMLAISLAIACATYINSALHI